MNVYKNAKVEFLQMMKIIKFC